MRVIYAIVFVSDMTRSVAFYREVLDLSLKFQTPEWTEFATEGATLALHASEQAGATEGNCEQPGRCRTGLGIPDLDELHKRMVEKNMRCAQEPKDIFGVRIAQYLDPDGLPISVSEERRAS